VAVDAMKIPSPISPGQALWNQRETIAALRDRFKALSAAVGRTTDLNLYQWAEFAAFALEFRPDLIIELGRGFGNSTCCFIEVAHRLGGVNACSVLSLCLSNDWFNSSVPRLKGVVSPEWFTPAQIEMGNMLEYDVTPVLAHAERCLILWDAHGYEIAEWVLAKLLPQLADKPHLVLMHDMSDTRFEISSPEYGETGIWKGTDATIWKGSRATTPTFWLGYIFSRVPQAISIVDFTSRNQVPLHSAAESLHAEIASDPARMAILKQVLGDELFSLQAHWFWFTLNEASRALSFPKGTQPNIETETTNWEPQIETDQAESQFAQLKRVARQLSDQDLDRLVTAVKRYGRELAGMPQEKRRVEVLWRDVQDSAGWRMLNAWRTLRDRALPVGTRRRKFYDSALERLRSNSSRPEN
jgi:hypothetical protein